MSFHKPLGKVAFPKPDCRKQNQFSTHQFHVVGLDATGRTILRRKFTRSALMRFMGTLAPCLVGMDACGGSQHLARRFEHFGHTGRLMAAQFVKPYLKSNKSDLLDAEAIAEALTRPTMRFVTIKTLEQQDLQVLHRARSLPMGERTAQLNQIRAFLPDRGLTIPRGVAMLRRWLPEMLEDADNGLSDRLRALISELEVRLDGLNAEIEAIATANVACQRLLSIPGIGVLTSTALVA